MISVDRGGGLPRVQLRLTIAKLAINTLASQLASQLEQSRVEQSKVEQRSSKSVSDVGQTANYFVLRTLARMHMLCCCVHTSQYQQLPVGVCILQEQVCIILIVCILRARNSVPNSPIRPNFSYSRLQLASMHTLEQYGYVVSTLFSICIDLCTLHLFH